MPPLAISSSPRPRSAEQRRGGGNAPVGEQLAERAAARVAAQRPRPAPTRCRRRPRRRRCARPPSRRRAPTRARDAAAGLLDDTGTASSRRAGANASRAAAEVAIALRLDQLLRGVQVHAERVGADRLAPAGAISAVGCCAAWTEARGWRARASSARAARTANVQASSGARCIARWLPRPKAMPQLLGDRARSRLIARRLRRCRRSCR